MVFRTFLIAIVIGAMAVTGRAAPIELELATERGVQITAPHEWLQRLTGLGIENVRIRSALPGDKPQLTNRGSVAKPRYHVVGVLTARNELRIPGGTFAAHDQRGLRAYFERLAADGPEAIAAPRGRFGLTEAQFAAVHADLAQSIGFATKGQSLRGVLDQLQTRFKLDLAPDTVAQGVLREVGAVDDEVGELTAGTGLAILLRRHGLALRPEKATGQPIVHRITRLDAVEESWPAGWKPDLPPSRLAPALMQPTNVQIDGYTLAETLQALGPRIKLPIYLDRYLLDAQAVDPTSINVRLAPTRTYYKRVLDRALAQARLAGEVRIDEAGSPLLWISR